MLICLLHAAVLENIVFDEHTREVDYTDKSVTGMPFFFLKKKWNLLLFIHWFICWFSSCWQRTPGLPIQLSTSPMQRYHVLVHTRRMSSFWLVMLLVFFLLWASWALLRPCTISSVATLHWYHTTIYIYIYLLCETNPSWETNVYIYLWCFFKSGCGHRGRRQRATGNILCLFRGSVYNAPPYQVCCNAGWEDAEVWGNRMACQHWLVWWKVWNIDLWYSWSSLDSWFVSTF